MTATHERRIDRATGIAACLILALAAWVRVAWADRLLSFDELWALTLTTGHGTPFGQFGTDVIEPNPGSQTSLAHALPAWRIWGSLGATTHPPLYWLALRRWRDAFGEGDRVAQAFSTLGSLVTIGFTFATARAAMGRAVALLIALAMALAPTQLYFGQELRSYALLVAMGSFAVWLMTRVELLGATRRRAVALACVPFFMLLTHYLAFGAALAIAAYGLWRMAGHRRAFAVTLVSSGLVYGVIWLPFALRQLQVIGSGDVFLVVLERDWSRELWSFAAAPIRQVVDRPVGRDGALLVTGVSFVLPWCFVRRMPALRPWALWLCGTMGALLALDVARRTEHLLYVRYTAVATPAALLAIVGGAYALRRWAGIAVAGALALTAAAYGYARVGVAADSPGYGDAVARLARLAGRGDAVVTFHAFSPAWATQVFQLHMSHEPGFFPRPIADVSGPVTPEFARRLTPRTWLIAPGPIFADVVVPGSRVVRVHTLERNFIVYELALDAAGSTTEPASR